MGRVCVVGGTLSEKTPVGGMDWERVRTPGFETTVGLTKDIVKTNTHVNQTRQII